MRGFAVSMPKTELEPAWSHGWQSVGQLSTHKAVLLCSLVKGTDSSRLFEVGEMAAIFVTSVTWRGNAHYQNCKGGLFKCSSLPSWISASWFPCSLFLCTVSSQLCLPGQQQLSHFILSLGLMIPALWSSRGHESVLPKGHCAFSSRRGKGRTQLSLLPRALQRQGAAPQAENGPAPGLPVTTSVAAEAPKMSNADFAKLLLRK